jgi:hypothetical protein
MLENSYRVNSYEDNILSIEINNAPPTEEAAPPLPPVYAIPVKKNSCEPKYEKLSLAQSLPSLDLSGLGYDVPVKRQPKLKPPIVGDFPDEDAMKGMDEYQTLKHSTK